MIRTASRVLALAAVTVVSVAAMAATSKPASPRGQAAAQVAFGKDGVGGKWLEVDYGRPLLRGRANIFGAGPDYGKTVNGGATVWRLGANETTRLRTEAALMLGGKKLAPGHYDLFVELKEGAWTLIVSTQPAQLVGGPKGKDKIWGSYGYDAKFDVVRVPMKMEKWDHSVEQLTIEFVDVSAKGGTLAVAWDHTAATVPFTVAE